MRNGICKKNRESGERMHKMVTRTDGLGRSFVTCERCGTIYVGGTPKTKNNGRG